MSKCVWYWFRNCYCHSYHNNIFFPFFMWPSCYDYMALVTFMAWLLFLLFFPFIFNEILAILRLNVVANLHAMAILLHIYRVINLTFLLYEYWSAVFVYCTVWFKFSILIFFKHLSFLGLVSLIHWLRGLFGGLRYSGESRIWIDQYLQSAKFVWEILKERN